MKMLGLIGGTTWRSTIVYYRLLNEHAQRHFGGVSSLPCLLASLNFEELVQNQRGGDFSSNRPIILDAAMRLKRAGAEGLVLCANTLHTFAEDCTAATGLPVIHIAEATTAEIVQRGFRRVALLGTRFTMEQRFFRAFLEARGIEALIPNETDRPWIHQSIVDEMASGKFLDSTRAAYVRVLEGLRARGAEAVVLGCTELPILLREGDGGMPLLDTTALHVDAGFTFACGDTPFAR